MFRNPGYLWLLPALLGAAAGFAFLAARRRAAVSRSLGRPETIARLFPEETAGRRRLAAGLRLAQLALIALALAGPQWGVELVPTAASANQTIIAIDVSRSMLAEDVKPSRLEKAKGELSLTIDQLAGGRVGVIAFAGEPVLMCPITFDSEAAKLILLGLEPESAPRGGTALGAAIRLAVETLGKHAGTRSLVLITDGEETAKTDPLGAAEQAAASGIRIFSIGIGSPEGEPIPLKDGAGSLAGYKKDKKGGTVLSKLGEETLKQIAAKTGGAYFRSTPGESEALEIGRLIRDLDSGGSSPGASTQYKNRFMIPLALAFLLLLAEMLIPERRAQSMLDRRGRSAVLTAIVLSCGGGRASAATGESLLREGNRRYEAGDYVQALEAYSRAAKKRPRDPRPVFNAGDALYQLEQGPEAAKAFAALAESDAPEDIRARAHYNLGNIAYQSGRAEDAVAHYREALALRPKDADIRHNLTMALRFPKPPPQPQKNPKDKPDKNDQKNDPKSGGGAPPPPADPRSRPQDMSKEDAERILQAGAEREKAAQQQLQKRDVGRKDDDVEADW